MASSSRPFKISHLGDSGSSRTKATMKSAKIIWKASVRISRAVVVEQD